MNNLTIVFDGGSIGNGRSDAEAYGSFKVMEWPAKPPQEVKFPQYKTNSEAEFATAISALQHLISTEASTHFTTVTLRGDSQLVIFGLTGKWKIRKQHLKHFIPDFEFLAKHFKEVKLEWQPRAKSVAVLGH